MVIPITRIVKDYTKDANTIIKVKIIGWRIIYTRFLYKH